ncbi:biofilm regulation protein kinase SiaB [Oryzomicrobium sp.]|uniref:biofilm regulation protein kinase SiaB n=1 Tax=Oryzomicrobium sp. TaxID=1911578 RepID=UPI0025E377D4|nr:biofilm regulation protein kinase SiaB [Oryzomicrobium sp.]MCE1244852.1 biofilm regulation protein kinase SiaB [Oryzomicrobium sp.]
MEQLDVYSLREVFNRQKIMLCFNGPFTATLIEEIGKALRKHMEGLQESPSSVSDVFSVYIELTQNIRRYTVLNNLQEHAATSTIVVSHDDEGRHVVSAGNVVRAGDGATLAARIASLAGMDKNELKAAFKAQLRQPRDELNNNSAGLGLIDMARKASQPLICSLRPIDGEWSFFSLRVVL